MNKTLTDSDVFTLIGHADLLRGRGETDMPAWCMDLAHRIAASIDPALALRVEALKTKHEQPEPRAEVTDDDKLCVERYRWVRERAWYVDAATYALGLRERWRNGDEPPPDADEVECALDAARAGGQ